MKMEPIVSSETSAIRRRGITQKGIIYGSYIIIIVIIIIIIIIIILVNTLM